MRFKEVMSALFRDRTQEDKQTHWFIGFLEEGQPGGFTAIRDEVEGVWVVTLFKRKLTRREKGLMK